MAVVLRKSYFLGEFRLEPETRCLSFNGEPVHLTKKPFGVLLYLIENRDRMVTRRELLDNFWDGHDVYEETLTRCVGAIRKALNDSRDDPKFIQTLWAEGYRFIGEIDERFDGLDSTFEIEKTRALHVVVEEQDDAELQIRKSADGNRDLLLAATIPTFQRNRVLPAVGVVLVSALAAWVLIGDFFRIPQPLPAPIRSIAVLPLKNLSGDAANEYFSDGVTESLISALSKLDGVKVISHSSVTRFKDQESDPAAIGKQLAVGAILEGNVRKDGDSIRVTVRLVSATDGQILWVDDTNDHALKDIFALQDEIARGVAEKLRIRLSGENEQRLAKRYTENTDAYQLYLRGRFHVDKWQKKDIEKGIEYFQQAVDIDSHYALAYVGLADAYFEIQPIGSKPSHDVMPKSKQAALRAIEIDDNLAEAHTSLGMVLYLYDWNWSEAEKEFKRAIELNPNSARTHNGYAWFLADMGRFDEAGKEIRLALELDPLSFGTNLAYGFILYYSRQYDAAIEQFHKSIELHPHSFLNYFWLERVYEAKGLFDQAIQADLKMMELLGAKADVIEFRRGLYAKSGWKTYWAKNVEFMVKRAQSGYINSYFIASDYARIGDKERAFEHLEKAYEDRVASFMTTAKNDPILDILRDDDRFHDLLRRIGLER